MTVKAGFEYRNAEWSESRFYANVATGVRRVEDLYELHEHFHAVGGRLHSFRFQDLNDWKSCGPTVAITFEDQVLGTAIAGQTEFQLIKTYTKGLLSRVKTIKKPVSGSVRVGVDETEQESGWSVDTTKGIITFSSGLTAGQVVTAGFEYDVPVRFDTDRLPRQFRSYLSGEANVPIIEVRIP